MRRFLFFLLIVILSFTSCGCAQQSQSPPTDSTPAPTTGSPLATLSDEHPDTELTLNPGVFLLSFQVNDPQILTCNLQCKQSWAESTGLRINSPYNGSLAFGIPVQDECTINISGSGIWTAQVTEFSMDNPLQIPVNLSGSGTDVSSPFSLEKGEYIFQREETGEASPEYQIMMANGSPLMDASNTYVQPFFGKTETFKIIDVPQSGTYFLCVISNDKNPIPWHVSILSIPSAPQMGPGPAIRE